MMIKVPKFSLVLLIGPSGSGKTTFARKHFRRTQVLSSDQFRAMISDSAHNQAVTREAFEALHFVAGKRLANGKLTVIDATNVQREARRPLIQLAKEYNCYAVGIVFDLPERTCLAHNRRRGGRRVETSVIRRQSEQMQASLGELKGEGLDCVYVLRSVREVDDSSFEFLTRKVSDDSGKRYSRISRLNQKDSSDTLSGEI